MWIQRPTLGHYRRTRAAGRAHKARSSPRRPRAGRSMASGGSGAAAASAASGSGSTTLTLSSAPPAEAKPLVLKVLTSWRREVSPALLPPPLNFRVRDLRNSCASAETRACSGQKRWWTMSSWTKSHRRVAPRRCAPSLPLPLHPPAPRSSPSPLQKCAAADAPVDMRLPSAAVRPRWQRAASSTRRELLARATAMRATGFGAGMHGGEAGRGAVGGTG